jgi:colicin import membrane protein
MPSIAQRTDFYPPRPQGTRRAVYLALLAHLFLAVALTWGVSWKREAAVTTVEAELWSSLPQQAAPKLVQVPQPPQPKPRVEQPEPPTAVVPQIAVEKEKLKPPLKVPAKPEPQAEPKPALKAEPKPNTAPDNKQTTDTKEAERQKNMERMAGLAGASGASNTSSNAQQSTGMAGGWDARVKARVNPQISYSGERAELKDLELSISILPDGTISGRPRVLKSSGSPQWDDAVARAFEKAESLPRDANGKLPPSPFLLTWKARE